MIALHPIAIADHRSPAIRTAAGLIIGWGEQASGGWPNAQYLKGIARSRPRRGSMRRLLALLRTEGVHAPAEDALERAASAGSDRLDHRQVERRIAREHPARRSRRSSASRTSRSGSGTGSLAQQQRVRQREDRSIRSDPQRQSQNRDQRKARRAPDLPHRKAKILQQPLQPGPAPGLLRLLVRQRGIPKCPHRRITRFLRRTSPRRCSRQSAHPDETASPHAGAGPPALRNSSPRKRKPQPIRPSHGSLLVIRHAMEYAYT